MFVLYLLCFPRRIYQKYRIEYNKSYQYYLVFIDHIDVSLNFTQRFVFTRGNPLYVFVFNHLYGKASTSGKLLFGSGVWFACHLVLHLTEELKKPYTTIILQLHWYFIYLPHLPSKWGTKTGWSWTLGTGLSRSKVK